MAMSWTAGLKLSGQSPLVQRLTNEIMRPRASVVASRWAAAMMVVIGGTAVKFGMPVTDAGDWIAPQDQKPIWLAVAAISILCIGLLIYYRRKITVDELRNIRLMGLCVLQLAFAFALATQAHRGVDPQGIIAVWAGSAAIARFFSAPPQKSGALMWFFILWALAWLYENLSAAALFLIIAGLVVWQVVDSWSHHFRPADPYQAQLTAASHGAAFVILRSLCISR
jgi:hypothetical protein